MGRGNTILTVTRGSHSFAKTWAYAGQRVRGIHCQSFVCASNASKSSRSTTSTRISGRGSIGVPASLASSSARSACTPRTRPRSASWAIGGASCAKCAGAAGSMCRSLCSGPMTWQIATREDIASGYGLGRNVSVDRIDNARGYVKGNIRLICSQLNYMRGSLSDNDFILWCELVVRHNGPPPIGFEKEREHAQAMAGNDEDAGEVPRRAG